MNEYTASMLIMLIMISMLALSPTFDRWNHDVPCPKCGSKNHSEYYTPGMFERHLLCDDCEHTINAYLYPYGWRHNDTKVSRWFNLLRARAWLMRMKLRRIFKG